MQPMDMNGFVWWDERELQKRESIIALIGTELKLTWHKINPAINMLRVETPCIIPADWASSHLPMYKIDDGKFFLRGESTRGTYLAMDKMNCKLPVILYQINKSFRNEDSDAMRLSKLRLREFWQMEFQLFYSKDTKADYHSRFLEEWQSFGVFQELPAEELPPYSLRTTDIEVNSVEVASLSTRKDYSVPVFEMSFGLDRLVEVL